MLRLSARAGTDTAVVAVSASITTVAFAVGTVSTTSHLATPPVLTSTTTDGRLTATVIPTATTADMAATVARVLTDILTVDTVIADGNAPKITSNFGVKP
jgi:hypothetical protein